MNRKLWYLKQLNLFRALPEKQMKYISEHFAEKEYGKRQVILEPEDRNRIFILKRGRVEIYQLTPEGKKVIVDVLGPGNVFGDLGGVDEFNDHFVEATTDAFVCVMEKGEFFDMITQNPQVTKELVRELFSKAIESEKQVAALASDNLLIKAKDLLLRLAKRYGVRHEDKVIISAKFTHEKMAEMIGVSRPTMTELLNYLDRQKIIKREGKLISFNPQRLAAI